jgi:S-adenosylmethionine-dependent methyltransferase
MPMKWEDELAVWDDFNAAVYGRLRLDLINRRLGRLDIATGTTVLDVGCGTGESALLLGLRGATVTVMDHSPAMLRRATQRAGDAGISWTAIEGDAADIGRSNLGAYDLILCHNVLAYLSDGEEVVKAMIDRLNTHGRISLVVSNSLGEPIRFALEDHDLAEALHWATERPRQRQGNTFDHRMRLHDRTELTRWVEGSGLRVEEVSGINVIAPYLDNEFKQANYQQLIELEETLGAQAAYVDMAVHMHLMAVNG